MLARSLPLVYAHTVEHEFIERKLFCLDRRCPFSGTRNQTVQGTNIYTSAQTDTIMIELPLSVIAWLSVVVVQAVVHYVVLGARRGRAVSGPEEEPSLEECLSLDIPDDTPESVDASFSLKDSGYECTVISADPSTPILMGAKETIIPDPDLLLELLEQTGTDLFKVSVGWTIIFRLERYHDVLSDQANLFPTCGRDVPSSLG